MPPVTQKQRPVPEPLKAKLDMYVKEGVTEGPLGADKATGWVHNVMGLKGYQVKSGHKDNEEGGGAGTVSNSHTRAAQTQVTVE